MLRFFRLLRKKLLEEGHIRKYIWYALGEILLVMIGILLALQVNNWNQERQMKADEKMLLKNVLLALETDSTAFESAILKMNDAFEVYEMLYELSQNEILADSLKNTHLMRRSISDYPVSLGTYPELASEVIDPLVKEAVIEYYSSLEAWISIQQNYNDFIENVMRPFLGKIGVLNYGYHHENPGELDKLLNNQVLIDALDQQEVQQMLFEAAVKTRNLEGVYQQGMENRKILIYQINRVIQ
ncbi:MAG: hypothetical protein ACPGGA_06655 [Balneolaceae bacterium]